MKNYKDKDLKELQKLIADKKLDLLKNQAKIASDKEKNIKIGWKLRKEIAQLLTIIKTK